MIIALTSLANSPPGCRDAGSLLEPGSPLDRPARTAPRPDTPVDALRLLEWCWDHASVDRYAELLTDDYRAGCSDPALPELGRAEELEGARRVFADVRTIRFGFGNTLVAIPDQRPGKLATWHRQITAETSLDLMTRTNARIEVREDVTFYLVRGDSALIPHDLEALGFGPDAGRWYVERWQSQGPASGVAISPGATGTSWCALKRRG